MKTFIVRPRCPGRPACRNDEMRREIHRLLRLARPLAAKMGRRIEVDPVKASLIDFATGHQPKEANR